MTNRIQFQGGIIGDEGAVLRYPEAMLFGNLIDVHDPSPHAAALNMAIDEVLLANARDPMLRIYRWERPAVSFGYFGRYGLVAASWPGREIVRRMTGGGVVPHGDDVTYSLIVPAVHPFAGRCPRDIYRCVHEALAMLVGRGGETPALAGGECYRRPANCFESPAEFDLLAHGRKIAGAAMRRTRNGLLLQGSLREIPGLEDLRTGIAAVFGGKVDTRVILPAELADAESLSRSKYETSGWTRRV